MGKILLLSLIFVLAFDFFPQLAAIKFLGEIQLVVGLLICLWAASFLIKKARQFKKPKQIFFFLVQPVLALIFLISFDFEKAEIHESIKTLFSLAFVIVVFELALLLFKPLVKLFHFLFFVSARKKFFRQALAVVAVILFTRNYFLLAKRVQKLEGLVGAKKLVCDEKVSIQNAKKTLVRVVGTYAEGSGFFVGPTGFIVTNHHVIASDPNPKIILSDSSIVQGEVVMADRTFDLAFIKIPEKGSFSYLEFADSERIEPMEELISLGYPFGLDLSGEATVIKGRFVAKRKVKEMGLDLIQTDISLNPGASGGPIINVCGEVVAINYSGTAGLGMGISGNDVQAKRVEMAGYEDKLKDVEKIVLNPDASPEDCVRAFYTYQTIGKLKEAYDLLSKEYTGSTFEEWQEGYKNTLNVALYEVEGTGNNQVFVKFSSTDLVGEEVVYKYFEGIQTVKKIEGKLKIDKHEIKEIPEPDWEWFWE